MMRWGHKRRHYSINGQSKFKRLVGPVGLLLLVGVGFYAYPYLFQSNTPEQAADKLQFDSSVAESEQQRIKQAITEQTKTYKGTVTASAETTTTHADGKLLLDAYVPVTHKYAVRQSIGLAELTSIDVVTPTDTEPVISEAIAKTLNRQSVTSIDMTNLSDNQIAFIPARLLDSTVKLLVLDGAYYLDDYKKGAVFRTLAFDGFDTSELDALRFDSLEKESVFTFNQTGVTALTRTMMPKLRQVGDPTFFSKEIGPFLANADITHVSNEVSFQQNCQYHTILFCSPPEFIETLKASGVDVVELTGNHNNDVGSQFNTESINTYHQLGWGTVGGGLNTEEAAKPYMMDKKGSKVALLAYNYPDSPNGGAIAGATKAGANGFDFDRIKSDIEDLKAANVASIIVDVQFWECYAYPDGYVEYPICDQPITDQTAVFRKIIDLGADMVVGTSAHQPQTFEFYNGKPIYYGLGNLYFEQTQWPGTERGIILTHYYHNGKLLQTKLTPTVYNKDFVVKIMTPDQADYLFDRLKTARSNAGLN